MTSDLCYYCGGLLPTRAIYDHRPYQDLKDLRGYALGRVYGLRTVTVACPTCCVQYVSLRDSRPHVTSYPGLVGIKTDTVELIKNNWCRLCMYKVEHAADGKCLFQPTTFEAYE